MPSTYRFIPLYGANDSGPMCSILQIDKVLLRFQSSQQKIQIMLDCGWDDRLDPAMLQPIKEYASTINAILISHPDFSHLGALPYIYAQWNCKAPVFINSDAS